MATALGRRVLIEAIDHALAGEFDPALAIVREHANDRRACHVGAIVLRLRGEKSEAMRWYRNAGIWDWPNADPQGQLLHLRQEYDFQY
ncbi:MAG: hypothetical protein AAFQ45_04010 [Pseudomonadota bacterium]